MQNIGTKNKYNKFINGPINVIRLEGKLFGITKILYIFMDVHLNVIIQTECQDVRSIDITNYFVKNFDKISDGTKIYDFFLETFPSTLNQKYGLIKKNYMYQIRKLFQKSFYLNNENKMGKSNTFS